MKNKIVKFFVARESSRRTSNTFSTPSRHVAFGHESSLSLFCYGRKWYYFFSLGARIIYFCSSGLELSTTLILKKFLPGATRRQDLFYRRTSKTLRADLRKYNKGYKAVKHSHASHVLQFTRGVNLAKFLHLCPASLYFYGNLTQLPFFLRVLQKTTLLASNSQIYYYP